MGQEAQMGLSQAEDREFFERELASFVPDSVFDAHCHVWLGQHSGHLSLAW